MLTLLLTFLICFIFPNTQLFVFAYNDLNLLAAMMMRIATSLKNRNRALLFLRFANIAEIQLITKVPLLPIFIFLGTCIQKTTSRLCATSQHPIALLFFDDGMHILLFLLSTFLSEFEDVRFADTCLEDLWVVAIDLACGLWLGFMWSWAQKIFFVD